MTVRIFENGTPKFNENSTTFRAVETGSPATPNTVLREDGTHELREDGSLILREN